MISEPSVTEPGVSASPGSGLPLEGESWPVSPRDSCLEIKPRMISLVSSAMVSFR